MQNQLLMSNFNPVQIIGDFGAYIQNCATKESMEEMLQTIQTFESMPLRFGTRYTVHSFRTSHAPFFKGIREIMTEGIKIFLEKTDRSVDDYKPSNDYYAVVKWNQERMGRHQQSVDTKNEVLIIPEVSSYLFMTDDYEGGEFNFTDLNISIKPKAGDMIVFNSDAFISINPIKEGGRKIEVNMPMYLASKDID